MMQADHYWFRYCYSYCLVSTKDILWSLHLTIHLYCYMCWIFLLTITQAWEKTPISPFLITRMFLYPSSVSLPNVYGNMPTVWILALVYLFFSLSTCPLQVCSSSLVEPCVWIHGSHAIWCQQAPSATLIYSQNSLRSVSHGSNLKDSQVSHKCCLKFKITSWKTALTGCAVHLFETDTKLDETKKGPKSKKVNWKTICVCKCKQLSGV